MFHICTSCFILTLFDFDSYNAAFIRTGDYRISQLTTREERSFGAEVQVIMGNIP